MKRGWGIPAIAWLVMASGRSVSKENSLTFHNDGLTHWANELEFGFAP
jgi:hypothetical protein